MNGVAVYVRQDLDLGGTQVVVQPPGRFAGATGLAKSADPRFGTWEFWSWVPGVGKANGPGREWARWVLELNYSYRHHSTAALGMTTRSTAMIASIDLPPRPTAGCTDVSSSRRNGVHVARGQWIRRGYSWMLVSPENYQGARSKFASPRIQGQAGCASFLLG